MPLICFAQLNSLTHGLVFSASAGAKNSKAFARLRVVFAIREQEQCGTSVRARQALVDIPSFR
jgi:hypothetical protein